MTLGVANVPRGIVTVEINVPEHAAAVFVEEHFAFVWRTLRRFGVPESEADDAAQRVFIIALQKLDRIDAGRERAFLFTTAVRTANKVRRSATRKPWTPTEAVEDIVDEGPSTEELVEQRRARARLDAILDGMPDAVRAVFVLYEVEEMTMKEIAELLGVPPGTVASRLRKGRQMFAARVKDAAGEKSP